MKRNESMKKKPLLNEKIIEEFQDSYLEDLMKDYNTLKERSDEEVEDTINAFVKILKVLEYRKILFLGELLFNDSKLSYLYQKGKLPEDFNLFDNDKLLYSPLFSYMRPQGSKEEYKKYIVVVTSGKTLSYVKDNNFNYIEETTIGELYKKYLIDNNDLDGIVINPLSNNFILNKDMCKLIAEENTEDLMKKLNLFI